MDDQPKASEEPTGEELVHGKPSRYAVPLSTLVAGAYVGVADQTTEHPSMPAPDWTPGVSPAITFGPDGADGDG